MVVVKAKRSGGAIAAIIIGSIAALIIAIAIVAFLYLWLAPQWGFYNPSDSPSLGAHSYYLFGKRSQLTPQQQATRDQLLLQIQ